MKKPKKNVLLAWSGGIDSTGLLCEYLDQGCHVDAFSVIILNNVEKNKRENAARFKMSLEYFRDHSVSFLPSVDVSVPDFNYLTFSQPPCWLFGLLMQVRPDHDEVAIGYVMNDDAVSYVDDFQAIWKSFAPLLRFDLPPLVFPYLKRKKKDILESLPLILQERVTWCENIEEHDRCGECVPCRKMIFLGLQLPPPPSAA